MTASYCVVTDMLVPHMIDGALIITLYLVLSAFLTSSVSHAVNAGSVSVMFAVLHVTSYRFHEESVVFVDIAVYVSQPPPHPHHPLDAIVVSPVASLYDTVTFAPDTIFVPIISSTDS